MPPSSTYQEYIQLLRSLGPRQRVHRALDRIPLDESVARSILRRGDEGHEQRGARKWQHFGREQFYVALMCVFLLRLCSSRIAPWHRVHKHFPLHLLCHSHNDYCPPHRLTRMLLWSVSINYPVFEWGSWSISSGISRQTGEVGITNDWSTRSRRWVIASTDSSVSATLLQISPRINQVLSFQGFR